MYTGDTQILTLMFRNFKNKFYPFSVNLFCFYNKKQEKDGSLAKPRYRCSKKIAVGRVRTRPPLRQEPLELEQVQSLALELH